MAGPLCGLKILDFSTLLPGPYCTLLLADMGADVLRIESLGRPDLVRNMPPFIESGVSAAHAYLNRNKKSLALDLKKPEAVTIVKQLVNDYDIVIEQFRPGVMDRLGLGYKVLKTVNSRLIYCAVTGYGQTGPFRERAGHDINYLALSGLASYSGRDNTGPVLSGTQIADIAGGSHHAVMGVLAAVIERQRSGEGQFIDISMSDCAFALNTIFGAGSLISGSSPQAGEEMLNGGIFYDYYQTRDGRWLSVGSLEPKFAQGFFAAIGYPEWTERTMVRDAMAQKKLKKDIGAVIRARDFDEWKSMFNVMDVCVEPVLTVQEAAEHPHFQARGMVANVPATDAGSLQQIALPLKFSNSVVSYKKAGGFCRG